jgi:hypothetical protein
MPHCPGVSFGAIAYMIGMSVHVYLGVERGARVPRDLSAVPIAQVVLEARLADLLVALLDLVADPIPLRPFWCIPARRKLRAGSNRCALESLLIFPLCVSSK